MLRIVIGLILGAIVPMLLEHFMGAAPEWMWRTLSFLSLLLAVVFIGSSNVIAPYLRDYPSHPVVSTVLISLAAAVLAGGAWWFFFAWAPSKVTVSSSTPVSSAPVGQAAPAAPTPVPPDPSKIPALYDLYLFDFPRLLNSGRESEFEARGAPGEKIRIPFRVHMDFESKSKFISVYVPHSRFDYVAYEVCKRLPELYEIYLRDADSILISTRDPADSSSQRSDELVFTGKIFIYHEDEMSLEQLGALEMLFKSKKLLPQFRGPNYVITRWLQGRKVLKRP